jgi:hypothetical protein
VLNADAIIRHDLSFLSNPNGRAEAVHGPAQHGSDQGQVFRWAIQSDKSAIHEDLCGLGNYLHGREGHRSNTQREARHTGQVTYPTAFIVHIGDTVTVVTVATWSAVVVSFDALNFIGVKGTVKKQRQHAPYLS